MILTKNKWMSVAVVFIVLGIFNVVAFVAPFVRGPMFWTGYGFFILAWLLTATVSFYAFGRDGLKSKFYGVSLILVVWRYLFIQLVISLAEMALFMIPFRYGIAVNVILLGVSLIGLIAVDAAKELVEQIDEKVADKVFYIKSLHVDVEGLAGRTADEAARKALKELAETIRYSDPMSSPQLAVIENRIEAKVSALADSIADAGATVALCNELQQMLAERNRKCKALK